MLDAASAPVEHAELLDEIEELVCITDVHARICYVNRAWRETLGYTAADAAMRRPIDYVAAEHRTAYRAAAERVISGTAVAEFESVLIARGGARVVVRGRARPRYAVPVAPGATPAFAGSYVVFRDVTIAQQSEAMRDRLVATLEASPDYVSVGTRDGALQFVNHTGRALLGVDGVTATDDLHLGRMCPPAEAARLMQEIIPAALATGRWQGESVLRDARGTDIPVALTVIAHPSTRANDSVPYFVSSLARDLRPERAAVAALRASEARYRSVVGALDEGVIVTEADGAGGGTVVACNPSAELVLGLPPGTLCASQDFWSLWDEVVDSDGLPFAADALPTPRTLRTGVAASGAVFGLRSRDGVTRWLRASSRGLFRDSDAPGALPYAVVTTFSDISAERAAAAEINQLAAAVTMSPDGLSVAGPDGRLIYTNPTHDELYGYEVGALIGRPWQMLCEPEEVERLGPLVRPALVAEGAWRGEGVGRRRDGTHFPHELRMRKLPWGGVVTAVRDISERKAYEAALQELSQRDELTGLLNRRGFFQHAENVLAQAARTRTPRLLFYGDLDRFKAINDTRGHATGDATLKAVARALREVFGAGDVLGRLGGDEFVVVAEGGPERVDVLRGRLAAALARAAAQDIEMLGGADVAMSIGIATFHPDCIGVGGAKLLSTLLKEADAELYAVKAARRIARAA